MTLSTYPSIRLRRIATIRPSNVDKKSLPDQTPVRVCNYTDVYHNDEIREGADYMHVTATPEQIATFTLHGGDAVITKDSETPEDIGVAAYVPDDLDDVLCGYHLSLIRPDRTRVHPRFLFWALESAPVRSGMSAAALGITRFGLRSMEVASLKVPLPDLKTQIRVADFLDRETARIDAVVMRRERVRELLQERRKQLIATAVSGGMDSTSIARDVLLGQVPEGKSGWPVCRLKHVAHQIVDTEHATVSDYADGQYLVVRTTNVRAGELRLEGAKYTDETGYREWTMRAVPKPGDILLTREAPAGEACIVPDGIQLCIGQRMVLVSVDIRKLNPRYALYSLYGGPSQEFMKLLSQGSTVEHLNMRDIPNIPLVVPSVERQAHVVRFLDERVKHLDGALAKLEAQIRLFSELRHALITASVTGRKEVRTSD